MDQREPFEIRPAGPADFPAAVELLTSSGLPTDGLEPHFHRALVASGNGRIVGCVALEMHEGAALLRSLAVAAEVRGEGLGERLTAAALQAAKATGTRDVYLLTETAARFFPRFGFAVEDRTAAPAPLRESVEFQTACPSSAVMMHVRIAP